MPRRQRDHPAGATPAAPGPAALDGPGGVGGRALPVLAAAPAVLAALLVACGFWAFSYDDAFITYRYARNWAEGLGLVYNPGEAVLGTTAPGYALLLGLLSRVTGVAVPGWGTLLSLAGLVAATTLVSAAARPAGPPAAGPAADPRLSRAVLAGLAGSSAVLLRWNVELLGAEAFVILALAVAAGFLALERDRPVAAGLLAAAAMACRLDAGLAAAALGLVLWRSRRRFPLAFAVAGLAPLAPWLAWLQLRFGSVLPNTLGGKQSEFAVGLQDYSLAEWLWLQRTLPLSGALALLALAVAGLVAGWHRGFWRRPFFVALALWLGLHEAAYRLVDVPFAPWYQVPLLAALAWLAALGAWSIAAWAVRRLARAEPRAGRPLFLLLLPLPLAIGLLLPVLVPSARYVAAQWGSPPDPRLRIYTAVGRLLEQRGQGRPGGTVAAVEIGALGWATRAPVLDLAGLVSPRVLAAKSSATVPQLVARERPACLVDAPVFRRLLLDEVLREPQIAAGYRPVAAFSTPEYGGGRVRLLCRRDAPR